MTQTASKKTLISLDNTLRYLALSPHAFHQRAVEHAELSDAGLSLDALNNAYKVCKNTLFACQEANDAYLSLLKKNKFDLAIQAYFNQKRAHEGIMGCMRGVSESGATFRAGVDVFANPTIASAVHVHPITVAPSSALARVCTGLRIGPLVLVCSMGLFLASLKPDVQPIDRVRACLVYSAMLGFSVMAFMGSPLSLTLGLPLLAAALLVAKAAWLPGESHKASGLANMAFAIGVYPVLISAIIGFSQYALPLLSCLLVLDLKDNVMDFWSQRKAAHAAKMRSAEARIEMGASEASALQEDQLASTALWMAGVKLTLTLVTIGLIAASVLAPAYATVYTAGFALTAMINVLMLIRSVGQACAVQKHNETQANAWVNEVKGTAGSGTAGGRAHTQLSL